MHDSRGRRTSSATNGNGHREPAVRPAVLAAAASGSMRRPRTARGANLPARSLEAWAAEGRIRKRDEDSPVPKVSLVDVLQATRGCTPHAATQALRVLGCCGGDLYAGAYELVPIMWRLEEDEQSARRNAEILVQYLGYDPTIVEEALENQARRREPAVLPAVPHDSEPPSEDGESTEQAAALAPTEASITAAVTAAVSGAVDAASERCYDRLLQELRRTHVWNFSRTSGHDVLARIGHVVGGEELVQLDRDERIVRTTDFLREQLSSDIWELYGRKVKSLFALELKRAKLAQCEREETPPYVAFNQGEHRIVYTEADRELMEQVLGDLMPRLVSIAGRDELLRQGRHRTQRHINEFFTNDA